MKHTLATVFKHRGVDRAKNTIFGVSVATIGEAKGHGIQLDRKTLAQLKQCAETYSGGLKVKLNHGTEVTDTVGKLTNFSINGDQLRADLVFLPSAQKEADRVFDMAEHIPDTFGLSVKFSGADERDGKHMLARCEEIYSADIVDTPAANPKGLFSVPDEDAQLRELDAMLGDATLHCEMNALEVRLR